MTGGNNQHPMVINPSKKSLQQEQQALKQDVSNDVSTEWYPERIGWLTKYIAMSEERNMPHRPPSEQIHHSHHTADTLRSNVAVNKRRKRGMKRE